jgi:nucleolar pre-ribosomal-associated protein 1
MTILEQWVAKVGGQHISSEAAGVVGRVIRRLLLGTLGKMRDTIWVEAYVAKMWGVLEKLRKEGKGKEGLEGVVKDIIGDLGMIQGEKKEEAQEGGLAELLDES